MSADGSVTMLFAGEERRFRLAIGQLRELQETINKDRREPIGPWTLFQMILKGDAWLDDLRAVIRLGLIGGGVKAELIPGMLKRYVDEVPLLESRPIAQMIMHAALIGVPDDQVGKKSDEETPSPATLSSSASSTEAAASSASHPEMSTSARSGNSQHV